MTMSTFFTYGTPGAEPIDAVVRFISTRELGDASAEWLLPQIDQAIRSLFIKGLFKGEAEQAHVIQTLGLYPSAEHVIAVGYEEQSGADGLRLAAATAAKALKRIKAQSVHVVLPLSAVEAEGLSQQQAAQALTEGLKLAVHDRLPEKREVKTRYAIGKVYFSIAGTSAQDAASDFSEQWIAGITRGVACADGVISARDLTNIAGNKLVPEGLATYAEELARQYDFDIEIIDEWTAAEQGMGGLLGVGQGSINPPRMIVLHYKGAPGEQATWGLIGKGITFDTGGISLKRAPGMEEMIADMGGAAAVLGAMQAIGELKPAVNIIAVIPSAENMPSDRALKPGDVITMMNGLTVEVVNTDAEGRLVLGDGLTTAIRRGATKLVDVATLTGAVSVALGSQATGAVTNHDGLMQQVREASERAGERVWQLPAYPEYKKQIRSEAADLKNSGGREAGTITGGLFIGTFAEELPWVHLDIAGVSFRESAKALEPKGGTGVMVRTLVELMHAKA